MEIWQTKLNQDSLNELMNLSKRLNGMLEQRRPPQGDNEESMASADWAPVVDIVESEQEFLLLAELPGVQKSDVRLSVQDGVLTLDGQREQDKETKGVRYHRTERAYGRFARTFALPESVDDQKLSAEYRDGLLRVHLPKAATAKPRSVEVRVS
jgi:HSP20 family protein